MPTVYAQDFKLVSSGTDDDIFQGFDESLRKWIGGKWPEEHPWFDRHSPKTIQAENNSIFIWKPFEKDSSVLYDLTWRHPHWEDPSHSWASQITYCQIGEERFVSLKVQNDFEERPVYTSRPRLVLHLCERFTCQADGRVCSKSPRVLKEGEIYDIVHHELLDQDRRHPVLILTPLPWGDYVMDPRQFGEDFASLASLYVVDRPQSTFALTDELGGKELSCFNGALRLYLPKLKLGSNPQSHPLFLPRQLKEKAQRLRVAQKLARYTTLRYRPIPALTTLRDEREVKYQEDQLALLASYEKKIQEARTEEDFVQIAELYAQKNDELEKENAGLRSQLKLAQKQVEAYELSLRHSQAKVGESERREEEEIFEPDSVLEVVDRISQIYEDSLLVLPSALDAAGDSPFANPGEVLRVLEEVANVSKQRMKGPLGKNLKDVFLECNIDYRSGISEHTSGKLKQQYRFTQDEVTFVCEEHICLGGSGDPAKCLRIYLSTNGEGGEKRVVIGHVGRHLDVLSTN